jgi:hypothetical protein
MHLIAFNNET